MILRIGLLAILAVVLPRGSHIAKANEPLKRLRPNFVIVLADDLGYGDLGCYGHQQIKTPHLDKLAADGLRLTDCYSSAPVCSPSRSGMLTGRTPYRLGIYDWIPNKSLVHLQKSETTIATLLRDAGYATCHVGKWHCNGRFNSPEQPQPGDHGFQYWMSTQNNAGPSHENPNNFVRNGQLVGPLRGYSSQIIVDESLLWLKSHKAADVPFCLFVWFHAPHEPIATAPEFAARYKHVQPEQADYFGNVEQMDHEFGRLMTGLDQLGHRDNTLVMFTSDNGPETLNRYPKANRSHGSPSVLRGMKLHLYEAGIRVPGIIRWPGRVTPGTTSAAPVINLDVLPTLCELAGIESPSDRKLDGASLAPLFKGEPVVRAKPLYWQYDHAVGKNKVAVRDGDWKLLANADLSVFELYDLKKDPSEKSDLASAEPEKLRMLTEKLKALHAEVKAERPVWPVKR